MRPRTFMIVGALLVAGSSTGAGYCVDPSAADRMEKLSEGRLAPAGAVLVSQERDEGGLSTTGPEIRRLYADEGHSFQEVASFYAEELTNRGWHKGRPPLSGAPIWANGEYEIVVGETTLSGTSFSVTVSEDENED